MMESTLAVANSIAGVSGVVTDGRPIRTVPGTNIQSDEGEDFDAILNRVSAIIQQSAQGADPDTADAADCTGSCSTCGGCS